MTKKVPKRLEIFVKITEASYEEIASDQWDIIDRQYPKEYGKPEAESNVANNHHPG